MTEQQWPELGFYEPLPESPETGLSIQTTIDCDDPHAQARFWSAALGWRLEDPHDFVKAVMAAGFATEADTVERDGRLSWKTMTAIQHPDDLDKPRGTKRRVLFQHVPDRNMGKNAWHFDINVGRENIDAHVERLTSLGAQELYRIDEPSGFHTTMADPEGNLFCVQ